MNARTMVSATDGTDGTDATGRTWTRDQRPGPELSSIFWMYCRNRSFSSETSFNRSMFATRFNSSTLLTGFERKSSVPAATARSISPSSLSAVTIKIMILRVAGLPLSFWQT